METTYQLVFTHRALAMAEKATGHNLLRWFGTLEMSINDLQGMLLATLQRHHPKSRRTNASTSLTKLASAPSSQDQVVERLEEGANKPKHFNRQRVANPSAENCERRVLASALVIARYTFETD